MLLAPRTLRKLLSVATPPRGLFFSMFIAFLLGFLLSLLLRQLRVPSATFQQRQQRSSSGSLSPESVPNPLGEQQSRDRPAADGGQTQLASSLVLVGVMTAQPFLHTRALQIWNSWASQIQGRVIFFVAEHTRINESLRAQGMPIVVLRGVDDSYPPQKKSFAMLRWMFDNQLSNFNWFMRADDDLFVRAHALSGFLLSLDPARAHLLGQAGLGNSLEYGQLSLGAQDNYCMGGPGVILSRELLRQLAPHLQFCLARLVTGHEDVELGRCIRRHVGISCPWNYEMQNLFHNNASVAALFAGAQKRSPTHWPPLPFGRMLTLHPVKQPEAMRRIFIHSELSRLRELHQRRMDLVEQLEELERRDRAEGEGQPSAGRLLVVPLVPNSTADVPLWEFVSANQKLLFCTGRPNCPKHTLEADWRSTLGALLGDIGRQLGAREGTTPLQFRALQFGYIRVQPRFGVDFVLNIDFWQQQNKRRANGGRRIPVRRHLFVQQRFGPIKARILQQSGRNCERRRETINLVVALKGRAEAFKRFADNVAELAAQDQGIRLILVLYNSPNRTEQAKVNATLAALSARLPVNVLQMAADKEFSRGEALSAGAALLPLDSLLFFADVDVLIRADTLHRVRANSKLGVQVYFPVVFSEFWPRTWGEREDEGGPRAGGSVNVDHFNYAQRRGYFRHFGFGIVSIYRADFDAVGGFNLSIQGWGMEDVDLFERVIRSPALEVFRAPDPGLVHVFHPIDCANEAHNQSKAQREACLGTRAQSLASLDFLAQQFGPLL